MNLPLDLIKVALLAGTGWVVALALARGPASVRHDLWLLVALGAVLLPVIELLLPAWYVSVPAQWEALEHSPRWLSLALGVWAAGALLWAARVVPGVLALRAVARRGEHWNTPEVERTLADAARLAGVTAPVTVLRSDAVDVPVTWGVRHPVVALPAAAATWMAARLRLVLVHELVHVRRQDVVVEGFLWLAAAVYWFHPAMWLATRRVRLERERACDEAVLATGARASEYCEHLVEILRAATRRSRGAVVGAAMAAPCTLEHRVRALLSAPPSPSSGRGAALLLGGAVVIYALGALGICAWQLPGVGH
ncbi:MAG TPA: M56 family metallopeptidase [Gemmatimonadales bacterium]|nr:M56 family metallopeptidase [Gemmatimonadales bacterium]